MYLYSVFQLKKNTHFCFLLYLPENDHIYTKISVNIAE